MRAHAAGLDPWSVLRPDDRAQRILARMLTDGAEYARAADRQALAVAVGEHVAMALAALFTGATPTTEDA